MKKHIILIFLLIASVFPVKRQFISTSTNGTNIFRGMLSNNNDIILLYVANGTNTLTNTYLRLDGNNSMSSDIQMGSNGLYYVSFLSNNTGNISITGNAVDFFANIDLNGNEVNKAALIQTGEVSWGTGGAVDEVQFQSTGVNYLLNCNMAVLSNLGSPTAPSHQATKAYVDSVIFGSKKFYFTLTQTNELGIQPNSFVMDEIATTNATTRLTNTGVTNNQYLAAFYTLANDPGITTLNAGTFDVHIHASKTVVGTASVRAELYIVSNGVEIVEIQDSAYAELGTVLDTTLNLAIVVPTNIPMQASWRLAIKLKAQVTAGSPTIYVATDGDTQGWLSGGLVPTGNDTLPLVVELAETGDATTTSSSFELMAGMSNQPGAGTWLVTFSASGNGTTNGQNMRYIITTNNITVEKSRREFDFDGAPAVAGFRAALHTQALVTIQAGDNIQVKYSTGTGTFTVRERTMMITRVKQ